MNGLYHCTSCETLEKILKCGAFYPSYCLEESSYLHEDPHFAFAMICFADLQRSVLKLHMLKFSADVYIKMKKDWALHQGLSPVVYYSDKFTISSAILRAMASSVGKLDQNDSLYKSFNLFMGLAKQYKGHYFDKKKKCFSANEVCFYLEREWRYLPIVQNNEAYFLPETQYYDDAIRNQKRDELIAHGYILNFEWNDILEIGGKMNVVFRMVNYLISIFKVSRVEAASKVKVIY